MLQVLEFVQRPFGEQGELAGVDLVADDRHADVTRMDEAGQIGDKQVWLEPENERGDVLDVSRPGKPTANASIESFNGEF